MIETIVFDKLGLVVYSYPLNSGLTLYGFKIYEDDTKAFLAYEAAGFESEKVAMESMIQVLRAFFSYDFHSPENYIKVYPELTMEEARYLSENKINFDRVPIEMITKAARENLRSIGL